MSDRPTRAEVLKLSLDEYINLYVQSNKDPSGAGTLGPSLSQAQQRRRFQQSHYFGAAYQRQRQQQQNQSLDELRKSQEPLSQLRLEQRRQVEQDMEELRLLQARQREKDLEQLRLLQQRQCEELRLLRDRQREQGMEALHLVQQRQQQQHINLQERIEDFKQMEERMELQRQNEKRRNEHKQYEDEQLMEQLLQEEDAELGQQTLQEDGKSNTAFHYRKANLNQSSTVATDKEKMPPPSPAMANTKKWCLPQDFGKLKPMARNQGAMMTNKKEHVAIPNKKQERSEITNQYQFDANGVSTDEVIAEIKENDMEEDIDSDMLYIPTTLTLNQ